jgi:hypothetical protein
MRQTGWTLATIVCVVSIACEGQRAAPAVEPAAANSPLEHVKLFNDVRGFMAPILLPLKLAPHVESECNGEKQSSDVRLSFIVDTNGRARNIVFEQALGNDLDYLALQIMEADRFSPGELSGAAAAAAGAVEMHFEACAEVKKDQFDEETAEVRMLAPPEQKYDLSFRPEGITADGQTEVSLRPISDSFETPIRIEKVGGDVTPPKVLYSAAAEFSDYARKKQIGGSGNFSVVVDQHGLPQDVQLDTSDADSKLLDPSLVQEAIKALRQYRFKPAMKKGTPVAVRTSIEVDYRLGY